MTPDIIADKLDAILSHMEAAPGRPFSQAEIDEVREVVATTRRVFATLQTLGWLGKLALYVLGTLVLVLTQVDSLRARFWP